MLPVRSLFIAFTLTTALLGCSSVSNPACKMGEQQANNTLLYFGTKKPDGTVTDQQWLDFLKTVVTPEFPSGFTVWQASGQWLSVQGTLIAEKTYILNIIHSAEKGAENSLQAIVSEYQSRFHQEAVLRVTHQVCIAW